MSVEKELPLLFSHPGWKVRSKKLTEPRGRSKARIPGTHRKPRRDLRRSPPESHCKKGQVREKEKVWIPWNGLIVIGKRVELLDRNVKSNPKLESEYWKLEGTGKKFSKEKSTLQQETVDVKLLNSVGRTVRAPAGLEDDSPEEAWRERKDRLKAGVSKSTEMTAEREENLKSTSRDKLRTTEEDLRSRGDQLRQNEKLESSGENLMSKREKRVSIGEKGVSRGEKRRSADEKMDSRERRASVVEKMDSRERQGSIREKVTESREKRGSREKVSDTRERLGSIREKVSDSGEKRGSREKVSDTRERRGSIREKVSDSGERRGSREKVSDTRERRGSREKAKLGREKLRPSGEKLRTGDRNLRSTEDILESNTEELESDEVKREERSQAGSATEEAIERVINVTGDGSVVGDTTQEMQIPPERVEAIDDQGRAEKGVDVDSPVSDGVRDTADESVPAEGKDTLGEGSRESGG